MIRPRTGDGTGIGYVEVDEATVPLANRRAASAAIAFARRDLGLPPVRVRWFALAPPGTADLAIVWPAPRINGLCCNRHAHGQIWIRSDLTPVKTAAVALHETVHEAKGSETVARAYQHQHRKLTDRMGAPGWP